MRLSAMPTQQLMLATMVLTSTLARVAAMVPAASRAEGEEASWHQYVKTPQARTVQAHKVLASYTAGNVSNPDGLVTGKGPTLLSRLRSVDEIPSIVVDFGQNTAGLLVLRLEGASRGNGTGAGSGDGSGNGNRNGTDSFPGLRLAFSETLQFLGSRSDFSRSDHASGSEKLTEGTDQIAVKLGPYDWIDQFGCEHGNQVCADGLHGFRYVKIWLEALNSDLPHTSSFGTVSISSARLELSAFHGTPETFTGYFECSDSGMTQWWYDAVYTNDLCIDTFRLNDTEPRNAGSPTLVGKLVLHDGPKRDRDPYVGDLAVASLTSYLSHDVSEATRNVLVDLALHQREDGWIPPASINDYTLPLFDYPLWWVVCSCDYVLYTGNVSFMQSLWPVLVKTLDTFYPGFINEATGLVERSPGYGDYAFLPRDGPVTYYNALYVRALNYAADLAADIGHADDAPRWRQRALSVASALLKRNWDASVGAFFDGGQCDSHQLCPVHAQDGNSLAILSGVANISTPAQNDRSSVAESILAYLDSAMRRSYGNAFYDNDQIGAGFSQRVYAFISYFEIAARLQVPSAVESAFDEIRRLYGWMASQDPGTFWEGIGSDGRPYQDGFTSMSHGWSTGIVPLMTNYVLGITPKKPGFREWDITPVPGGGLTWARGAAPTPHGEIGVAWELRDASQFHLQVSSPDSTSGTVNIPVSNTVKTLELDGRVVYDASKDPATTVGVVRRGGYISLAVGGGRHDVLVQS